MCDVERLEKLFLALPRLLLVEGEREQEATTGEKLVSASRSKALVSIRVDVVLTV